MHNLANTSTHACTYTITHTYTGTHTFKHTHITHKHMQHAHTHTCIQARTHNNQCLPSLSISHKIVEEVIQLSRRNTVVTG